MHTSAASTSLCAVVWADTRSMGCGTTSCRDGSSYTICHYYPQGNFKWCNWDTGKCYSYRENVFRTACQNMTRNDGCSKCSKKVKVKVGRASTSFTSRF